MFIRKRNFLNLKEKDIEININKTDTINISGVEKQVSPTPIQFNF